MKQLFLALLLLPIIANAQVTNAVVKENSWTGIKWTTGLSWEQIKAKAKAENKYIFLDIYATWCGPCKEMEKNVFVSDAVGNYFNDKFISVRVQEDKTKNDNEEIKKWYDDAKAITRQFDIDVFPSFLFLNPQGIPTDLQIGYKGSTELINIAQASMLVGRVYTPRPEAFRNFKAEYRNGNINYKELPAMILLSARFDTSFRSELVSTYREYIGKLKSKERYNKQNISFWASFNVSSKSQFFQYFTRDGEQVDKAMQEPGFSARFIDRVVQHEIVTPFFIEQAKGSGRLMAGPYVLRSDDQGDKREADWSTLEKLIATKFDKKITERAMYTARIEWYSRFSNVEAVRNYTILKIRKYPMDFFAMAFQINGVCWAVFLESTDLKKLKECSEWMGKIVRSDPKITWSVIDTYAQLLYKMNQKQKAIEWEEKIISLYPELKKYVKIVALMKGNRPTYLEEGANWDGINHVNREGFK